MKILTLNVDDSNIRIFDEGDFLTILTKDKTFHIDKMTIKESFFYVSSPIFVNFTKCPSITLGRRESDFEGAFVPEIVFCKGYKLFNYFNVRMVQLDEEQYARTKQFLLNEPKNEEQNSNTNSTYRWREHKDFQ